MDFKSKIIKSVMAAEKEIEQLIASYEETINKQFQEIEGLRKYADQQEEIERQQKEIQELQKKLRISEGENLLLQIRLDLDATKEKKLIHPLHPQEKPKAKTSYSKIDESTIDIEWEKTLLQVRKDLEAVNEKKKRERTYYEKEISSTTLETDAFEALSGSSNPTIYRYKVNVIDATVLESFVRKYNLVERKAILPLYESKNSREIYLYTETETIYIDLLLKEIYMIQEEFDKLQARYSPLVIKHRVLTKIKHNTKDKEDVKGTEIYSGTMGMKSAVSASILEDAVFSEQSELNKMGYRISGVSREERWEVLRRAIPALGLKKVVNIISANVRLKKRQKNGEQKYQHAISEWEYDLSQLKKKYYYDGFKWPEL